VSLDPYEIIEDFCRFSMDATLTNEMLTRWVRDIYERIRKLESEKVTVTEEVTPEYPRRNGETSLKKGADK